MQPSQPATAVGRDAEVTACAWADGQWIVGHGDGTVQVLGADGVACHLRWRPHRAAVRAIELAPDGRRVATVSDDHGLRVWPLHPLQAAQDFGVRSLRYLERERLGLLTDLDRTAWGWVSKVYDELVLTRDVLAALQQRPLPNGSTEGAVRARALRFAKQRPSPTAPALHARAFRVLRDPQQDAVRVQRALREIRAAARLQPRAAGHRIVEALGQYRLGAHGAALEAADLGLGLPGEKRAALGHAIRALALVELNREAEAKAAIRQLRQLIRPASRAGSVSNRGARPWVTRALGLFE